MRGSMHKQVFVLMHIRWWIESRHNSRGDNYITNHDVTNKRGSFMKNKIKLEFYVTTISRTLNC